MTLYEKCVALGYLERDAKDVARFAKLALETRDNNEKDKYLYFIETRIEMMRHETLYVNEDKDRIKKLVDDIEETLFAGDLEALGELAKRLAKTVSPIYRKLLAKCPPR